MEDESSFQTYRGSTSDRERASNDRAFQAIANLQVPGLLQATFSSDVRKAANVLPVLQYFDTFDIWYRKVMLWCFYARVWQEEGSSSKAHV